METRPNEKDLAIPSFAAHSARGILRHQTMRRRTMLVLLGLAVVMLIGGTTVLRDLLNPHEHAVWFILFWLGCAWLTITALLLALFDVLMVRKEARTARRLLRERIARGESE